MAAKRSKPSRRRAKQARAQETTAVILEAAAQILGRSGYRSATTNRIAAVAGVSVGTLYQYFADKQAIFDALTRRETQAVQGLFEARPPDPSRSLEAELLDLFRRLVHYRPQLPALARQLQHAPDALLRRHVEVVDGALLAWTERLLEAHRAEVRVEDPALAAFLLVHATEGVLIGAREEIFGERLAVELTRVFTRYLRGDPET